MKITVLTIFPEFIQQSLDYSIIGRAIEDGILEVEVWDIREFAQDKHRMTDDSPFGGGAGMVMKPEPIFYAFDQFNDEYHAVMLTPQGKVLNQQKAKEMSQHPHLVLLCGHYEGIDQRVRDELIDEEISIGDYILTGGELPALVLIDALARYLPGVLGNVCSLSEESFEDGLLEYPQYTRPREFRGLTVPEILLSGDHKKIREWRRQKALEKTKEARPDLYKVVMKKRGEQ